MSRLLRFIWPISSLLLAVFSGYSVADKADDRPYQLIEGKQYEICRALLPVINTIPSGSLLDDPSPLKRINDLWLPSWKKTSEKKYIDLFIEFEKQYFPEKFSEENYKENFQDIAKSMEVGEIAFYTSSFDMDNSGRVRPVLRVDTWYQGRRVGGRYVYFPYIESTMDLDERYKRESEGEFFFFKGRGFRFEEWFDGGRVKAWRINITEPYFLHDRSPKVFPPTGTNFVCKFLAK